jgi:hypothetical protein
MNPEGLILGAALLLTFGVAAKALWAHLRFRGTRVVVCPRDGKLEALQLDALQAAFTAVPRPVLRAVACSQWPQRRNCGQPCLDQIEDDPRPSPVTAFLSDWYAGRRCSRCGTLFLAIRWIARPPALVDRQGRARSWYELPMDQLADSLSHYRPLCWGCHVMAELREEAERDPDPAVDQEPMAEGGGGSSSR